MGKYLALANKVERPAPKTTDDWLAAWQELAEATYGITAGNPQYPHVIQWLDICDVAFSLDSWPNFLEAAEEVKRLAKDQP